MEKIYDILRQLRPELDFHASNRFIEDGMLDSFDVVALVTELENHYGILIDALDIVPENFMSVETIMEMVKKNGGSV